MILLVTFWRECNASLSFKKIDEMSLLMRRDELQMQFKCDHGTTLVEGLSKRESELRFEKKPFPLTERIHLIEIVVPKVT